MQEASRNEHLRASALGRGVRPSSRGLTAAATLGLLALGGCNSASSPDGSNLPIGTYTTNASTGLGFIVDDNNGGEGNTLGVTQTYFGRLVTAVGFRGTPSLSGGVREIRHRNLVINPTDLGNGIDYEVQTDPITGDQTLVILRDLDDPAQAVSFEQIITALSSDLRIVSDNGFVGVGAYTMVPRNAAVVIQFDDLIDPLSINETAVNVVAGIPTVVPFESRILADSNRGDLADPDGDGIETFYTTRIIVDPTVSEVESFAGGTGQVLPVNTTGFPPSVTENRSNAQIRFATQLSGLSTARLLQNLTGHTLAPLGNGSVDFGSPDRPIVRAFRSGGDQSTTGDPYNGYLRDESAPTIVGSLDFSITGAIQQSVVNNREFTLSAVQFASVFCSQSPTFGDLITQPGVFGRVINPNPVAVDNTGVANNVRIRLEVFPNEWLEGDDSPDEFITSGVAPAQYLAAFDAIADAGREICFVEITPEATGAPEMPGVGVLPGANYTVRFNEPISVGSLSLYDTFGVSRVQSPDEPVHFVPGSMQRSVDLQEFTFTPDLPLRHDGPSPSNPAGNAESYWVGVVAQTLVPTDLAGNALVAELARTEFTIEPTAQTEMTGGRVVRFTGADEEAPREGDPGDPTPNLQEDIPEWNGQHIYDIANQSIRPRPVTRTQIIADRNGNGGGANANLIGQMAQPLTGQSLPLSNFGAKTQIIYRWFDFDLPFKTDDRIEERLDREFLNVDIEGLSLSPLGSGIVFESYPRFRMSMGHSQFLPDEALDNFGNIAFPGTGVTTVFENNYLNIVEDAPTIVHPDFRGYLINPGDLFQASSGTNFLPLPMNRGVSSSEKRFYTWRDTFLRTRGGTNGTGVSPQRWYQVTGRPNPIFPGIDMMGMPTCDLAMGACLNQFYSSGNVRTAGLPLLIDFDCFPTQGAQTLNVFDVVTAHPTQTTPFFRSFSAGGFDPTGAEITVDPDLETIANGGFDPMGTPPGTGTPGVDNTVYLGALDLVVRVSRSSSIYYPIVEPLGAVANTDPNIEDPRYPNPELFPAILDPRPEDQPSGTSIEVHYRGAAVIPQFHRGRVDATEMDPYGDFYPDRIIAEASICDRPGPPQLTGSVSHDPILCDGTTVLENDGITFLPGLGDSWRSDISQFNGAQFVQVHLTFTSNVETGLSPSLSSLALSWSN